MQHLCGSPLADAQSRPILTQHLVDQVHAMGIQFVTAKQRVNLSADGLVNLFDAAATPIDDKMHLAFPISLIHPQVTDRYGFP